MALLDKNARKEYHKQWRLANAEKLKGYQREQRRKKSSTEAGRAVTARYARDARARLRTRLFEAIGSVCEECGHEDRRVLQFAHARGDGNIHRAQYGGGPRGSASQQYYRSMLAMVEKEPGVIRTLCANCHILADWEPRDV